MIKKLMSGYDMAIALKHYKNGNIDSARGYLDQYFQRSIENDAVAIAFDATILVLEGKSERAVKRFSEGRALAEKSLSGHDAIYVKEYCLYYECLISNGSDCASHKNIVLNTKSSPKISRWLNLPIGGLR